MSSSFKLKLITSSEYHLWNDALHARALAKETEDKWNRGTYVRWTVTTVWTVLEMCCREALNNNDIGHRFKDDIKDTIKEKGLSPIDWGTGIWQKVLELKDRRKKYTHIVLSQDKLWPGVEVADEAIKIARQASKEIYQLAQLDPPTWLDDDNNEGWQ